MSRPKSDTPSYCLHKRSGRGYVTICGQQRLLPGAHASEESRAAYDRLIAEWLNAGRTIPVANVRTTVSTIAIAFWKHAQTFYVHPDGPPTGEAQNYRLALKPLRRMYGGTPAGEFGPKRLKALRRAMLLPLEPTDPKTEKKSASPGWSRTYANRQIERIKMVFRWAASEELMPASVYQALASVDALRAGKEGARETEAVEPVAEEIVEATLPHLPPPVAALVKLQLRTGARGGELFKLRTCDIDRTGAVWKYNPTAHKTAHHGHRRTVYFGPLAQDVLQPFLQLDMQAYLFRPVDAVAWRDERQAKQRKTPITPSQKKRAERAAKRPRKFAPTYTKDTYARAVARACEVAQVQHWHPHQLRHTAGTNYRTDGDFEAAKIVLGHKTDSMTQRYAERDTRKAEAIVAKIG